MTGHGSSTYPHVCLLTPGLEPRLMEKASKSRAGFVHLECESGVPVNRKVEARANIRRALAEHAWHGQEVYVRVDAYDSGLMEDDISDVIKGRPTGFMLAKCGGPADVVYADRFIGWQERRQGIELGSTRLITMIEGIRGLQLIDEIAQASPRMAGLSFGASDMARDFGYRRTKLKALGGYELQSLWAQSRVVMSAHAAGLLALSSPFTPHDDLEGTARLAQWSFELGYDIQKCVSPSQIETVASHFGAREMADSPSAPQGETSPATFDDKGGCSPWSGSEGS